MFFFDNILAQSNLIKFCCVAQLHQRFIPPRMCCFPNAILPLTTVKSGGAVSLRSSLYVIYNYIHIYNHMHIVYIYIQSVYLYIYILFIYSIYICIYIQYIYIYIYRQIDSHRGHIPTSVGQNPQRFYPFFPSRKQRPPIARTCGKQQRPSARQGMRRRQFRPRGWAAGNKKYKEIALIPWLSWFICLSELWFPMIISCFISGT